MLKIGKFKRWTIYQAETSQEADEIGGTFAAFLPETSPDSLDEPEWVADNLQEIKDFINSY